MQLRNHFITLAFLFLIFPVAFATTGAGKGNVPCTGTVIGPNDDIVSIINNGKKGQTFCIEGEHRITSSIQVRSGQSLIGTTGDSRISGAVVLSPWQATSTPGVYYYDGQYAAIEAHQQKQFNPTGGVNVCYAVTTYEDDLFFRTTEYNDKRVMRVLSLAEVTPNSAITTLGQAVTAGEQGRFFFDYTNHRIYLSLPNNQDPNDITVDLAIDLGNADSNALIYGPGQENVTLQNLFIEKGMNYGVWAGTGWTLEGVTVRFIHNVGVYNLFGAAGSPSTIDDTLITNNGRMGLHTASTTNLKITNSEMSWNNIANFRATNEAVGSGVCQGYYDAGAFHIYGMIGTASLPSVVIDNLTSHFNISDGLWSDGGTQYTQITNSTFKHNERYGYVHEISCQVTFQGNTIYDNGFPLKNTDLPGGGLVISDSNDGTFSSNLIYGNLPGLALHMTLQVDHPDMTANACLHAANSGDTSQTVKNNVISGNTIYQCTGSESIGKLWGPGGTLNSRGNKFTANNYHVADSTSTWFVDSNSVDRKEAMDWAAWQAGNHDTDGSLTVGCTPKSE